MTGPFQANNSDNSPAGQGEMPLLNSNGVGNGQQTDPLVNLINNSSTINLDPTRQPPVMKTLVYSPDIRVVIAGGNGKEYDVSADVVRGSLHRMENAASTFICELANAKGQYTKKGAGLFGRMDRITVYMKRVNWVQVFSGYLDTVPFAQMWAGNVTIKATCTLKRLLYTYWNPNLSQSAAIFNTLGGPSNAVQTDVTDSGLGDLLGNIVCWVGGWLPQNVHIQNFPVNFYNAMEGEFLKIQASNLDHENAYKDLILGYDHTAGVGSAAGQKNLSTGPGLGPQVADPISYKQQVIKAVDDRGMGPKTKDIQTSYAIEQYGAQGAATKDAAVSKAFQENVALGQNLQTQARTADAAILAFACVTAESGWLMYGNPRVPESLNYHFDALEPLAEGDSVGLFQQRNQGWGTVMQRMNAYASAGMFLDELAKIPWENMDPAQAIATVQRNRDGAITYSPFIVEATNEVAAIRAGQGTFTPNPNLNGIGVSSIAQAVTGQAISGTSVAGMGVPGLSQNSPAPSALPVNIPGRPQPDAQGAVTCALSLIGKPYQRGARGPLAFDAAGLIDYCYRSIGRSVGVTTAAQSQDYMMKVNSLAEAHPGDVIQVNGGQHTAILVQVVPPLIVEAPPDGTGFVRTAPLTYPDISGIYRYAEWGGPGPAPFNPVAGPGMPVGTGSTSGLLGGTGSDGQQEPIARNLFSYFFTPGLFAPSIANLFNGEKSFIDCQPLIQEVQAVCRSGLRNFTSAPNGDFIAYYPDYFGVDGKPIAMTIEDIEMKDVRINLTDDAMTTHVYVSGDATMGIGQKTEMLGWLTSMGVATVENETLFQRLKRVVPGGGDGLSGGAILQKYGVRPLQLEFNMVASHKLEFLVACQVFMQKWAEQYLTSASFTFMPELFPGMRVALANTGIVVYVSEVTHTFDWEQGFSTTAKIMAPSSVNGAKLVDNVAFTTPADASTKPTPSSVPGV